MTCINIGRVPVCATELDESVQHLDEHVNVKRSIGINHVYAYLESCFMISYIRSIGQSTNTLRNPP